MYPHVELNGAPFNNDLPTIMIVHGWRGSALSPWMMELGEAILKDVDANVFLIDWSKGADEIDYSQCVGNALLVAREISLMIEALDIDPDTLHCIGHSLGAHVMGEVGRQRKLHNATISRITGLDPAQQLYEGYDPLVRLDPTDAQLVDIVHTNSLPLVGYGYVEPLGHIDMYMNGGYQQPGCIGYLDENDFKELRSSDGITGYPEAVYQTGYCGHGRSHAYLIESYNNTQCTFWGRPISKEALLGSIENNVLFGTRADMINNTPCDLETCMPLGPETAESKLRGTFIAETHGLSPFCAG